MKFDYYKNWGIMGKFVKIIGNNKVCLLLLILIILLFFCIPTVSSQELQITDYDEFYREVYVNWELLDILELDEGVIKGDIVYEILDDVTLIVNKAYRTITLYYKYTENTQYKFYTDLRIVDIIGSLETIEPIQKVIDFDKFYESVAEIDF